VQGTSFPAPTKPDRNVVLKTKGDHSGRKTVTVKNTNIAILEIRKGQQTSEKQRGNAHQDLFS
jgi:hypothetical protein